MYVPHCEPVVLTVVLHNVTGHAIRLGTAGADLSSFRLSLTGPQRQSPGVLRGGGELAKGAVPLLAAGHDLLNVPGASQVPVLLPPRGRRQYRFVISRLADLTVAGNYTIQVGRLLPVEQRPLLLSCTSCSKVPSTASSHSRMEAD